MFHDRHQLNAIVTWMKKKLRLKKSINNFFRICIALHKYSFHLNFFHIFWTYKDNIKIIYQDFMSP